MRKPKSYGCFKLAIVGDEMAPRWPAGAIVSFDAYRVEQIGAWATGLDVIVQTGPNAAGIFRRVSQVRVGEFVDLIALDPDAGQLAGEVFRVPWNQIDLFAVADAEFVPSAKGVA
jgi:hypothetical protein